MATPTAAAAPSSSAFSESLLRTEHASPSRDCRQKKEELVQFRDARQTPCVGPTVLVDQRYQKGSSPGTKVSIFISKVSIFDFRFFDFRLSGIKGM